MFLQYVIALIVAALAILIAIILGDYGPWYLSWLLGSGFMVVVATPGGGVLGAQAGAAQAASRGDAAKRADMVSVVVPAAQSDKPRT